jgi:hypothetical protein
MRYLTWCLNWDDTKYGTGPEGEIAKQGGHAEASMWANPDSSHGTILGYLTQGDIDLAMLASWQAAELTQAQALAFAQEIEPAAYLLDDGIITVPMPEPV